MSEQGQRVRVGVSACLLGQRVRYDGDHKDHPALHGAGPDLEWVPVCPEVELGLGVPREPIALVGRGPPLRLLGTRSGRDLTAAMHAYAARRVAELAALGLDGYVLKSRSPSCGLTGVKVQETHDSEAFERRGQGLFAAELIRRLPALPVVEEHDLDDPEAARRFFAQARDYHRRRQPGTPLT